MEIRRMGPQIGVEVTDVDVKTLDDKGFAPIYQAWLDYNVMVVRDQDLTIPDFVRYSRRFGPVVPHPSKSTRNPDYPEFTMGLPVEDSEELLDLLWAHTTQDKFTWRQDWRVGDLIWWDNRCAMHRRDAFDPSARRLMHRTQLKGSRPV